MTTTHNRELPMQHTYRTLIAELTREQRLELLRRSNRDGLLHLCGHWGAIVLVALLIVARVPGWQALLLIQGVLIISTFALLHEAIHKTPFKTGWLNPAVATVCGFLIMIPPVWFRHFHTDHHRYTNDPARDPELASPRPTTVIEYVAYMSGIPVWWSQIRTLFINASGSNNDAFVPARDRTSVQGEACLFLLAYAFIIGGSVYMGSTVLLWTWLLPVIMGQPFLRAYLLAEHGGCPLVDDMLINSRTTFTTALVRFLAWNMPYHAEHHAFPAIPFHNLPGFHEFTRDHLKVTENGYLRFHGKFLRGLTTSKTNTEEVI